MDLELIPYVGLGPIRFGMSREEVRLSVGGVVKAFRKTPNAGSLVDTFEEEGIHVHYDAEDRCQAVEVASPANPRLQGHRFVGLPFADVREWLHSLDADLEVDDSGLTSWTLGLGVFAPYAEEEPSEPVESMIAFRRGYYD